MLQNNIMMVLSQAAHSGGNPMLLLQQMAGRNPQVAQAMQMMNGKDPAQLRQLAANMAKERGVDLNALAQQMGLPLPK